MDGALPQTLLTIGQAVCNAQVTAAEDIWRVILNLAQEKVNGDLYVKKGSPVDDDRSNCSGAGTAAAAASSDMSAMIAQMFLITCYDLFSIANCYEQTPWSIGPNINYAQKRALQRCHALKRMSNTTICRSRGAPDSSTDDEDDYCDELPDIFNGLPPTFRRGPRHPVRSDSTMVEPLPFFQKSEEAKRSLEKAMSASFVFEAFSENESQRNRLIDALKPVVVTKDTVIMTEGDSGDGLYMITSGKIELQRGPEKLKELTSGDLVGELAVLHPCKRTYTAKVVSDICQLYFLDRRSYQTLVNSRQPEALPKSLS